MNKIIKRGRHKGSRERLPQSRFSPSNGTPEFQKFQGFGEKASGSSKGLRRGEKQAPSKENELEKTKKKKEGRRKTRQRGKIFISRSKKKALEKREVKNTKPPQRPLYRSGSTSATAYDKKAWTKGPPLRIVQYCRVHLKGGKVAKNPRTNRGGPLTSSEGKTSSKMAVVTAIPNRDRPFTRRSPHENRKTKTLAQRRKI